MILLLFVFCTVNYETSQYSANAALVSW